MALMAKDPADRVEQLIMISDRLGALIATETKRIEARLPPLDGELGEEKNRLANAYRLELARIKIEPVLLQEAPPPLLKKLKAKTNALHAALAGHEIALNAVKLVSEGLVQAMAEEITRQRSGARGYGAGGALTGVISAVPVASTAAPKAATRHDRLPEPRLRRRLPARGAGDALFCIGFSTFLHFNLPNDAASVF